MELLSLSALNEMESNQELIDSYTFVFHFPMKLSNMLWKLTREETKQYMNKVNGIYLLQTSKWNGIHLIIHKIIHDCLSNLNAKLLYAWGTKHDKDIG